MEGLQDFLLDFYWIDLAVGGYIFLYVCMGAVAGTLTGVVRLILLTVALGFVYLFADHVAEQVGELPFVDGRSFKLVALVMLLLAMLAARMLSRVFEILHTIGSLVSVFSSFFGAMLAFVRSVLLLLVINLIVTIGVAPKVLTPYWEESALLPYLGFVTKVSFKVLPPAPEDSFPGELKQIVYQLETNQPLVPNDLERIGRHSTEVVQKRRTKRKDADAQEEKEGTGRKKDADEQLVEDLSKTADKILNISDKVGNSEEEEEEEEEGAEKKKSKSMIREILINN